MGGAGVLRVVVADDSLTMRKEVAAALAADPGFAVVAEAADGRAALDACRRHRPDLVCMDLVMPDLSGLEATEQIMAYCPTPILIVSASTNRGELFHTYDALAAGAVDVFEKPRSTEPRPAWGARLRAAARTVAQIRVITHPRGRLRASAPAVTAPRPTAGHDGGPARAIVVGASTGGPAAVRELLRGLPPAFPVPVLLVLHIAEAFGAALADWLDRECVLRVRMAREREPLAALPPATVCMAPPDRHLTVRSGALRLEGTPPRHGCRPAVDALFESVASDVGSGAIGCLLTGMGRDGADGLLALHTAGAFTIAQDAATSAVHGMPGEAIRLGAADAVLPIDVIAGAIRARVQRPPRPPELAS